MSLWPPARRPAALPRNGQHLLADQAASTESDLLPPPLTAR